MSKRERPFSGFTQFVSWERANCGSCAKSTPLGGRCRIESALYRAMWNDGSVSRRIAERMGYLKSSLPQVAYTWPCPEHDPAWKVRP